MLLSVRMEARRKNLFVVRVTRPKGEKSNKTWWPVLKGRSVGRACQPPASPPETMHYLSTMKSPHGTKSHEYACVN